MPTITFQPAGITVHAEAGTDLIDAARLAGVEIDAPCGGKGICGNCAVRVLAGNVVSDGARVLTPEERNAGYVLACRSSLGNHDVTIEVRDLPDRHGGQFGDAEDLALLEPSWLSQADEIQSLAQKYLLHVPPPQKSDGLSDLDRLARTLRQGLGVQDIRYSVPVLRQLTDALRVDAGRVTVTAADERPDASPSGHIRVTALEGGDTTARHYGVAIDVGTTTVAVQLVDLAKGKVLGVSTDYNGQLACGLDVISRIDYARRPGRREELRRRVLKTVNHLIGELAHRSRIEADALAGAAVSGNTTMIHMLLGLNPETIRLDPFTPTVLSVPMLSASDVGIRIGPAAPVLFSPAVGSYVGGDITAGILCTDLADDGEAVDLFMDIGTNGEVVLGNRDFLLAAACSAGPAFEGGGIKCGMRAATGAIERVDVDRETGRAAMQTIGGAKPRGICGSGMISLLAALLKAGWIDAAGKLNRTRLSEAIRINGRKAVYVLATESESATGRAVSVDEQEIENIIRAKAALYAACSLMLAQVGMAFRDLSKIYIAGGFGRYLDLDDAIAIGLLPNLPRDRFHFLGNASLRGSYRILVSEQYRRKQSALARRMTYLELTTTPDYMDQYTAALFLPHTDPSAFQ